MTIYNLAILTITGNVMYTTLVTTGKRATMTDVANLHDKVTLMLSK